MLIGQRFRRGQQSRRFRVQPLVPVQQQFEHLLRLRKGPVRGEKHVHERTLQLAVVRRQGVHQPGQGGRLDEPHPDRFPLQVGDLIVGVLL